ncbi:MAG: QcrA and Rieske domain-containing protein [Gaiellales bacterium]
MIGRLRKVVGALLIAAGLRAARLVLHGEPVDDPSADDPAQRREPRDRRAELVVAVLLLAAAAAGAAFVAVYAVSGDTQLLGLCLGGMLCLLAAALGTAGRRVVVQETAVEPRPQPEAARDGADAGRLLQQGGAGISRRRLLAAAGGVAGASLTAAVVTPLASLGPSDAGIGSAPWSEGTPLVDGQGLPLSADAIETGSFVTAFPEGSDPRELGSPVVVVRIDPVDLRLPAARRSWAPEGLLAFSKICTHAGCAVAMLRYPLYAAHTPGPALVCPCHYSTFDVTDGGSVIFGPAGRPLPQLPLRIMPDRTLQAAGALSGPVGPSWWGVRRA